MIVSIVRLHLVFVLCVCVFTSDTEGSLSGYEAQYHPPETGVVSGHPWRDRGADLQHGRGSRSSA